MTDSAQPIALKRLEQIANDVRRPRPAPLAQRPEAAANNSARGCS